MTRRAAALLAVCLLACAARADGVVARRGRLLKRSSTTPRDVPAESTPTSAAPLVAPGNVASHPLTAHVEYQLDGLDAASQRTVRALLSEALARLREAVHLPGAAPSLLLLPRSCSVVQQWRRDGVEVGAPECVKAEPNDVCLQARHNASLFEALVLCSGRRPGDCFQAAPAGVPLNADLVLYVTAKNGGVAGCGAGAATRVGSSAVLAAAGGACETDKVSGRPVAGAVNLCPARLAALTASASASAASADQVVSDLLHELMHVLAFSEGLYASFANGSSIAPGPDGGLLVRSPAVLEVARRHFACPTLQGVPLETEGGDGTARTHWKLRQLNGELMVGTVITGQRPVLSNFTLALLQDSGWYSPQFNASAPLGWGAGAGCAFVTAKTCAEVGTAGAKFFCNATRGRNATAAGVACTRDYGAVGTCNLLPLTRPEAACFAVQPFSNWVCRDAALATDERQRWGYAFGPSSRCLPGGSVPWSRVDASTGGRLLFTQDTALPACFRMRCNSTGALLVSLGPGTELACPEGKLISLSAVRGLNFKSGDLGPCPAASDVCPSLSCPADCSGVGDCGQDGRCRCWPGYDGADCGTLSE